MLISTKGRYALRVMIDLAEHQTDGYIPLKEVAQRQDISDHQAPCQSKYSQRTAGQGRRI